MSGRDCYHCALREIEYDTVYEEKGMDLSRKTLMRFRCPISKDLINDIFLNIDCKFFTQRKENTWQTEKDMSI